MGELGSFRDCHRVLWLFCCSRQVILGQFCGTDNICTFVLSVGTLVERSGGLQGPAINGSLVCDLVHGMQVCLLNLPPSTFFHD